MCFPTDDRATSIKLYKRIVPGVTFGSESKLQIYSWVLVSTWHCKKGVPLIYLDEDTTAGINMYRAVSVGDGNVSSQQFSSAVIDTVNSRADAGNASVMNRSDGVAPYISNVTRSLRSQFRNSCTIIVGPTTQADKQVGISVEVLLQCSSAINWTLLAWDLGTKVPLPGTRFSPDDAMALLSYCAPTDHQRVIHDSVIPGHVYVYQVVFTNRMGLKQSSSRSEHIRYEVNQNKPSLSLTIFPVNEASGIPSFKMGIRGRVEKIDNIISEMRANGVTAPFAR